MSELRLSIIIPVYRAEAYIGPCVESLFRQGLEETQFEVILVDDGTPDRSIEVLEELLAAHACIRVIRQENQGVSVARNTGIGASRGKYLLFVDADDLLVDDCLGRMLDVAERNRLDMLKGSLKKAESGMMEQIRNNWIPASFVESEVKTGEQAFIEDYDPMEGYCWLYCFRREFLVRDHISFLVGKSFAEDTAFTTRCHLHAERFMAVPLVFYLYRQHTGSAMSTMNVNKLLSMNGIIDYIHSLRNEVVLSPEGLLKLERCVYASFAVLLWYLSHYRSLYGQRLAVIRDLKQRIPDLKFSQGYQQRLVSFCWCYCPSCYLTLRYWLAKKKY